MLTIATGGVAMPRCVRKIEASNSFTKMRPPCGLFGDLVTHMPPSESAIRCDWAPPGILGPSQAASTTERNGARCNQVGTGLGALLSAPPTFVSAGKK